MNTIILFSDEAHNMKLLNFNCCCIIYIEYAILMRFLPAVISCLSARWRLRICCRTLLSVGGTLSSLMCCCAMASASGWGCSSVGGSR